MTLLSYLTDNSGYEISGNTDIEITGINYNSRKIEKGNIFVCLHGQHTDGHRFVKDALLKGAAAIITDKIIDDIPGLTQIIVADPLKALSEVSARFFGYPSKKLTVIGVTGTNGKTSITYLLESILAVSGKKTAVFGTINYRFNNEIISPENTTPFSSDLQYLLHKAVTQKFQAVAIEVSSHALVLNRVDDVEFDAGIFTNLTRDHLDYHKTFDEYFQAKLRLFKMLDAGGVKQTPKIAVINIDDEWGNKISGLIKCKTIKYGFDSSLADIYPQDINASASGTVFNLVYNDKKEKIRTPLIGKHNIYNILAAAGYALGTGMDIKKVRDGIEKVSLIPGRLEKVDKKQPFTVLIDYAHTDDALKNVLSTIKEIAKKRVITVFGCGGDRDRTKRPVMGEIAVKMSDYVILTSDNPRTEDPKKIICDIEIGIKRAGKDNYMVKVDRREALKTAVEMANKDDIILVAGKGHETYQIIGNNKIHFSDREVVEELLV